MTFEPLDSSEPTPLVFDAELARPISPFKNAPLNNNWRCLVLSLVRHGQVSVPFYLSSFLPCSDTMSIRIFFYRL